MSFWSEIKFFGINFTRTFFIFYSSGKIFLTVSLSAFTVSVIIRMLIQWSPHTVILILVTVCGVETETCQSRHWSCSVLSRPLENYLIPFWNTQGIENSYHSLFQQLIALSRSFFKFNEKFHIDTLLVFFVTHCYRREEKTRLFPTSIEKILLKR